MSRGPAGTPASSGSQYRKVNPRRRASSPSVGTWSPMTAPGRGSSRYGAVRSGLPAEAR